MTEALAARIAVAFGAGSVRLRLGSTRNEGWKPIHLIAFGGLCRRLRTLIAITEVLLARLMLFARIRLGLARLELRLLLLRRHKAGLRAEVGIAVAVVAVVVEGIAVLTRHRLLLRLVLAELFLRRSDQAEIVFGVLVVVFGGDRITGRARIARELDVLFRNMRGGAANFDVRSVGLENPGHRVLAAPVIVIVVIIIVVPAAHTLVVVRAVSHVVPFTDSGS